MMMSLMSEFHIKQILLGKHYLPVRTNLALIMVPDEKQKICLSFGYRLNAKEKAACLPPHLGGDHRAD